MTRRFIRNTRRFIAFLLVVLMTFENPAATLAADTGTVISESDDRLIEENDPVMAGPDDAEEAILEEETLEENAADDALSDGAQDIIIEEDLSEDVLSDDMVSDASVSEDLIEEATDEGYFEDDIVEEYEIPSVSSNELLHELPQYRSENVKVYERNDHSITAYYYPEAVNYLDDEGYWNTIDNRLHYEASKDSTAAEYDGYTNNAASFDVRFAETADEDKLFSISEDGYKASFAFIPQNTSGTTDIDDTDEEIIINDGLEADEISLSDNSTGEETATTLSANQSGSKETDKNNDQKNDDSQEKKWHRSIKLVDKENTEFTPKGRSENIEDIYEAEGDMIIAEGDADMSADEDIIPEDTNYDFDEELNDDILPELPEPQTVIYEDIEKNADLEYQVECDGIKETVIADSPSAPSSYTFRMELQGMSATLEAGRVVLWDNGDTVYEIPAPEISDAGGAYDSGAYYTLKKVSDDIYELGIHANPEWFTSSDRVFPVRIDPTIKRYRPYKSLKEYGDFVCIGSDGSKSTEKFKVGREVTKIKKNKKVVYRTYMNPMLPAIERGSVVTDAKMRISAGNAKKLFYVVPVPDRWSEDSISSKNQPFKSLSLKKSLKKRTDYGKNGNVVIDVTKDVKEMENGSRGRYGWCFVSEDEGAEDVRTITPFQGRNKPFLEVTYRDYTGTEEYYNCHDMYVGNAGQGNINDYSGRLSFSHLDATSEGERMTMSISHIYDIAYGERKGEKKWLTADGQISAYGEHFRLSTDVRLLVPTGETDIKKWPYVYIDSDGTKHYFKKATVSYYVNGEKKTFDNNSGKYPAAKDEDGLGLYIVPVKDKNLKDTYPLKIVNKSGSMSMYFDTSGYLWKICDSNRREDEKNKSKKEENKIEIFYEKGAYDSIVELSRLREISDEIDKIYDKNVSDTDMIEKAVACISKLETFENESIVLSSRYDTALHVQKAKDSLMKLPDGDKKSNYKNDLAAAVSELKKSMKENFNADVKRPVKVTDAAGISSELSYDSTGRLLSMSDPYEADALINYEYDGKGRLIKIIHPNGVYASYKYDVLGHITEAADEMGNRMSYVYGGSKSSPNDQVTKYTEYYGKKAGQSVLISHEGLNTVTYIFSGKDDKSGTKDDIENVYCFDNKGRSVSAYSRLKNTGEVIGGTIRAYTDEEEGSPNKIKEEAVTGSQVVNLLNDGSFEKAKSKKGEEAWRSINTCNKTKKCHTVKKDNSKKYIGAKAAHIKLSEDSGHNGKAGFKQSVTAPESGNYTASVYVRTKNLKDANVRLIASTNKKASEAKDNKESEEGSTLESGEGAEESGEEDPDDEADDYPEDDISEELISDDAQLESNDGFKRIETTIKVKKGETITVELSLSGKSGEAWFDCAQLEKGSIANQYNLIPNSGFEDGLKLNPSLPSVPSGWAYGAQAVKKGEMNTDDESAFSDEEDEEESCEDGDTSCVKIVNPKDYGFKAISGKKVLMISGNPIKKRTVVINPNFGSDNASYTFSCYVKTDCAPVKDKRKCGIYVGGKDASSYLEDNASGKYLCKTGKADKSAKICTDVAGWQYVSLSLPVKNWYGKVIEIRFDYECGALYIDDCMLTKNEVKTKTYTSSGKLKTERKGERTTKYENDSRDRKKKVTNPGGSTVSYKYDKITNDVKTEKYSFKQPGKQKTDTHTMSYEYDAYGNVIRKSGKSSGITQTIVQESEYDADGKFIIKYTDSAGNATSIRFDEHTGLLLSQEDASGIKETYTYDKYDNLTGFDRNDAGSAYTYDTKKHDQLKKIDIGAGNATDTISYKYDNYGNVRSVTRLGKDKKLVGYKYMPRNGKLKQTIYGNGNRVTYSYNNYEQLTSKTYGKNDVIKYEYDNRGNTARVTDDLNSLKYRYYYDEHGRVTNASVYDCSKDKKGEILSFQCVYDKAGRESVFAYYTGGKAFRTEYGYTSDDKISTAKLPSGGIFKRDYDGFDRVTCEKFEPQKEPQTGEKKARGNGAAVVSTYGYLDTDRGKDKGKTTKNKKTIYNYTTRLLNKYETTVGTGKKKKTAVSDTLEYDELNRVSVFDGIVYTYDELGRLINARDEGNERSWDYSYDPLGNITSSKYTEKGVEKEENYSYDKQNLVKFGGAKAGRYKGGNPRDYFGNTLKWERGRQLKSVTPKKIKSPYTVEKKVEYTYASDGSRLSKTVGKKEKRTDFILNGSLILAEKISYAEKEIPGETLNYYYSSDGKLVEIGYSRGDEKERHYSVIRNAMGDIVALYTAEGTLVGTYEYDPYGRLIEEKPNEAYEDKDSILTKNPFRFRGYYYDRETGWYYLQSRYYDPTVKRFINADSPDLLTTDCDNLMQYNLFMYCNGDPVNYSDPNGHDATAVAQALLLVATVLLIIAIIATIIPTCGASGGALALAGGGTLGGGAALSSATVANTSIAGSAVAAGTSANIFFAQSNKGNSNGPERDYKSAKTNEQANEWAKKVGYDNAEELKQSFVGKNNGSLYNMIKDKKTGEIILQRLKPELAPENMRYIHTNLYF